MTDCRRNLQHETSNRNAKKTKSKYRHNSGDKRARRKYTVEMIVKQVGFKARVKSERVKVRGVPKRNKNWTNNNGTEYVADIMSIM